MFTELCRRLAAKARPSMRADWSPSIDVSVKEPRATAMIPWPVAFAIWRRSASRAGLSMKRHRYGRQRPRVKLQHLYEALREFAGSRSARTRSTHIGADALADNKDRSVLVLRQRYQETLADISGEAGCALLRDWPARRESVRQGRGIQLRSTRARRSPAQNYLRIAEPSADPRRSQCLRSGDWGELLRFLTKENLPGGYPYTAGVYPYRRLG